MKGDIASGKLEKRGRDSNEGGIEPENEPNFRPAARGVDVGVERENSGQGDVGGQPGFPGARKWVALSATLPVLGRTVSGCLKSEFLGLFQTIYGSSVQSIDTQLGARQRRRTPTIHRGRARRTSPVSATAVLPVPDRRRVTWRPPVSRTERGFVNSENLDKSRHFTVQLFRPCDAQLGVPLILPFLAGIVSGFVSFEVLELFDSGCGGNAKSLECPVMRSPRSNPAIGWAPW